MYNVVNQRHESSVMRGRNYPGIDGDTFGGSEEESSGKSTPRKPTVKKFLTFLKETWTGVKFSLDSELEDLESQPITHRPHSTLKTLCKTTKFSESELKRIYRTFKNECPTGIIKEDAFKTVYCQFFPQGANVSQYAHYVFQTLDQSKSGFLHFEDLVHAMSSLCRGTLEDKLKWTFYLYDVNKDGHVCRLDMIMIITAVYQLMGKFACAHLGFPDQVSASSPPPPTSVPSICGANAETLINEKVDAFFRKMDTNKDGIVTWDEFLYSCKKDRNIRNSINAFETYF